MRNVGFEVSGPEGYLAARDLAEDNLRIGLTVIVDSVNPLPITRDYWRETAARLTVELVEIEVVCSDRSQHRVRVESRVTDIPGLVLPTWQQVLDRHYETVDDRACRRHRRAHVGGHLIAGRGHRPPTPVMTVPVGRRWSGEPGPTSKSTGVEWGGEGVLPAIRWAPRGVRRAGGEPGARSVEGTFRPGNGLGAGASRSGWLAHVVPDARRMGLWSARVRSTATTYDRPQARSASSTVKSLSARFVATSQGRVPPESGRRRFCPGVAMS